MSMDYLPIQKRIHSNAPLPLPFIPDEIIAEILSFLSVKSILQLKCLSKAWKTLLSDPTFVQKHFQKSSRNSNLLLTPNQPIYRLSSVKSFLVLRLLETNLSTIVSNNNLNGWMDYCQVVGTCKGLLCLFLYCHYQEKYWFRLWNPATRTLSEKLGIFHDHETLNKYCMLTFGCDISAGNYKVVALSKVEDFSENAFSVTNLYRVLSLGDNCWRNFQFCSSIPVCMIYGWAKRIDNGLHLNGTVNWLALPKYTNQSDEYDWKSIANAQHFVIVSLDLSTETCTQFLLPPGFVDVPLFQPTLHVLRDCLCFSHDFKRVEFVIWQMKEFGVQESWNVLFKIDYLNIQKYNSLDLIYSGILQFSPPFSPLYISKNRDTLIWANYEDDKAYIYNKREKRVKRIRNADKLYWFSAMDYVESLVSPCLKSVTLTPNTLCVCGSIGRKIYPAI